MSIDNDVQQRIANASDETLITMIDKPSDYLPEAIALAQQIAAQRGGEARLRVAVSAAKMRVDRESQITAQAQQEERDHKARQREMQKLNQRTHMQQAAEKSVSYAPTRRQKLKEQKLDKILNVASFAIGAIAWIVSGGGWFGTLVGVAAVTIARLILSLLCLPLVIKSTQSASAGATGVMTVTCERLCSKCGTKYNLSDYNPDAAYWSCSACKAHLPKDDATQCVDSKSTCVNSPPHGQMQGKVKWLFVCLALGLLITQAFPWEKSAFRVEERKGNVLTSSLETKVASPLQMFSKSGPSSGNNSLIAPFMLSIAPILLYIALVLFNRGKWLRVLICVWFIFGAGLSIMNAVDKNKKADNYRPRARAEHPNMIMIGSTEWIPLRTPIPPAPCVALLVCIFLCISDTFLLKRMLKVRSEV